MIERVDHRLWTDTELRPASGAPPYYGGTDGQNGFLLDGTGAEEPGRERLYQSRAAEEASDWLRRGGSTRTSKYRQRMERARRDFLAGTGPDPANYGEAQPSGESFMHLTDPTTDRFRKSTEDLFGRRQVEYRGPLLQKFNSGEFAQHPPEPMGTTGLASGLGRSPYEQVKQGNRRESPTPLKSLQFLNPLFSVCFSHSSIFTPPNFSPLCECLTVQLRLYRRNSNGFWRRPVVCWPITIG